MEIAQAFFLGLVQGVTEVLPVSSSGHLILVPWFFNFTDPGLIFNVALHLGTLIAVIIFFRKDWVGIIANFFKVIKRRKFDSNKERLPFYIILATVPGALGGYFLESRAEGIFRNPLLIAGTLFLFGVTLLLAEKTAKSKKEENKSWVTSLVIGAAQALAIIPGVSRSGITISVGMFQGFTREAAARFSFLISVPIILGAVMFSVRKVDLLDLYSLVFWVGLISAVITSFLTIKFLMNFVRNHKLSIFAYYRFLLAFVIVIFYLLGER